MLSQKIHMRLKVIKIIKQMVLISRDLQDTDKLLFYNQIIKEVSILKHKQIERLSYKTDDYDWSNTAY